MTTTQTETETPTDTATEAATGIARRQPGAAWPLESAVFSAAMLAERLPWVAAPARALGLTPLTPDGVRRGVLAHLRRTRSGRPVRLSTPFGTFLVPLAEADAEGLLTAAAEAGALGPATGLTPGGHRHPLSPHAPLAPAATAPPSDLGPCLAPELARVVAERRADGTVAPDDWRRAALRLARRVVVGAEAVEDSLLSAVLRAADDAVGDRTHPTRDAALRRRLLPYLTDPDPEALAGRLRTTGIPAEEALPAVAHALALISEAVAKAAWQALALHSVRPADPPAQCVATALGLWPPLPASVHPVRAAFTWQGLEVAADCEILHAPGHVRERHGGAGPTPYPSPAALCPAPGGCAAAGFAVRVAREVVRGLVALAEPALVSPELDVDRLPDVLDAATVRLSLLPRDPGAGRAGAVPGATRLSTELPQPAVGRTPASYGALARATADRLEAHADRLAACAADSGWNAEEAGEGFRLVLLGHADRCARAADDLRLASRRLLG
ncbi:hypothetical protein [Streptomyces sp. RerS4]|uniref:hypothetical protein n=1 Tax=Streptomyces sp. RerS4 TaxID=2942449 RepID=UPI00201C1BD9|nr:hypothetical protein [Streptomyces sp. RerS4]UQX03995.1 hypothetical protein M4D82_28430 [Streptomyces sp. RerS4]